jgi:hypothetical protein
MASTVTRRPLPAVVALLALLILTAIVWWRVLNRGNGAPAASGPGPCSSTSARAHPSPSPSPSRAALPDPQSVTVWVLNSTFRAGIAGKAQAALVRDGFRSSRPAGNDLAHQNKIKSVAQIRFGRGERAAARLVRYYLPGARLVKTHHKRPVVTISLGRHYRRVATPAQVRSAMQADAVQPSSAPATSSTHAAASC